MEFITSICPRMHGWGKGSGWKSDPEPLGWHRGHTYNSAPNNKRGRARREWQDTMWHPTNYSNAWGARTAAVQWIRSEQQTQPCGYSIQIWWVRVLWRCSSNLMYVICILYAVCAVRQLLWARLPFNDPTERKTLHVGLHCGESYHSLKFQFLPGYQLDKIWCALLSSGPACGSRWLTSIYLFLYRSDGISVAILGSS